MKLNYKISAIWQPRIEAPEAILVRFRNFLLLLQDVNPLLRKWYHVNSKGICFDVDELGDRLISTIIGRVAKGDFGEPEPWMGYNLINYNRSNVTNRPDGLWLSGNIGSQGHSMLSIFTNDDVTSSTPIVSYTIFKAIVFALARAFEPDWVDAAPNDLYADLDMSRYDRPPMLAGWMIALSPPIARLVRPPAGVITERMADGSLFMAATDETFVTSNPKHVAGSRAIQAVLDPLNDTVPFKTLIAWKDPAA